MAVQIARAAEPVTLAGRAMGTTWSVKVLPRAAAAPDPAALQRAVADRLEALERIFSTYRPQSELSRFNAAVSTAWIPVSPELARLAAEARRLHGLTGGAFDVTVAPLVALWGFGPGGVPAALPTEAEVAAARARVDGGALEFRAEPPALRKAVPGLAADFSSLAKGFAADAVGELLRAAGAPDHLVQVGGDVRSGGRRGVGRGWAVAIESPEAGAALRTVALAGEALSTSGDYRNFHRIAGRRYGHIVDPRTGAPVAGELAAVSVIRPTCAESSALATALFVLGAEAGHALAVREGWAGVFAVREGGGVVVRETPAFAAYAGPPR